MAKGGDAEESPRTREGRRPDRPERRGASEGGNCWATGVKRREKHSCHTESWSPFGMGFAVFHTFENENDSGEGDQIVKWKLKCAVEREGDWYASFYDELSIASQGRTVEEARSSLEEAIEMFFEDASTSEIMKVLSNLEAEVTVEIQREADIPPCMRSQDTQWEFSVYAVS